MISRKKLISSHNPVIQALEMDSPLSVGNGELAFTADVTGMQTFYDLYHEHHMPLCTMSQWGWHTEPVGNEKSIYTPENVEQTEFKYENWKFVYPVEKKPGSEAAYDWLRQNPHRANLVRIGLSWDGDQLTPTDLSQIHQQLHLYEGRLESHFFIKDQACCVTTVCAGKEDTIGFSIKSRAKKLKVEFSFPYGSHQMSGSNWEAVNKHETLIINQAHGSVIFKRTMDDTVYYVALKSDRNLELTQLGQHHFNIATKSFSVHFSKQENDQFHPFEQCLRSSQQGWKKFWNASGMIDFKNSEDQRAKELERRIILSQYLSAIQCCGSLPPQETGLTCNSWHGKFHLEMHLWHSAYLPLWNQSPLLEKSFVWYQAILLVAQANAQRNHFQGARWPKQVAYDGVDSPSPIAPLLIWQQSHLIYLLELVYQQHKSRAFLESYWEIVSQTMDFMCDFMWYNPEANQYELRAPMIPAQEEHHPLDVKNPTFELEYWRFSMGLGIKWGQRLDKPIARWQQVYEKIAVLPEKEGVYLAHEQCATTFTRYNRDHPSMLGALGLIPSDRVEPLKMKKTLEKVLETWEFDTMWGWDFALMAMTAVRLGLPDLAMDLLLMDSPKNQYVTSGHNFQRLRTDLPVYLPGNGSLLLAVALMVAGYGEGTEPLPGIPKNGRWHVEFENIAKFPY